MNDPAPTSTGNATADAIITGIEGAAGVAATVYPPAALIASLVAVAAKYGGPAAVKLFAIWTNASQGKPVTLADVQEAFADLEPWESLGIPDKVPAPSAPPAPTP